MVRRRCEDEKPMVRKAAILALEKICLLHPRLVNSETLPVFCNACRDAGLSVRKQAADSITSLLQKHPMNEILIDAWLTGVLPLIIDRENTAADLAVKMFNVLIMDGLNAIPSSQSGQLAWKLVSKIEKDPEKCRYLRRFLQLLVKQNQIQRNIASRALLPQISGKGDFAASAWMILCELAPLLNFDSKSVFDSWFRVENEAQILPYVAQILAVKVATLSEVQVEQLKENVVEKLTNYDLPSPNIASTMYLLWKCFEKLSANADEAKTAFDDWCQEVASKVKIFFKVSKV